MCALASEEMEKPVLLPEDWPRAEVHAALRSPRWLIEHGLQHAARRGFSVVKPERKGPDADCSNLPRKGTEQLGRRGLSPLRVKHHAGLIQLGKGVHGFTLEPGIGGIFLCLMSRSAFLREAGLRRELKAHYHKWPAGTKLACIHLQLDTGHGQPLDWRSAIQAVWWRDVHRILLEGGIYLLSR